MKDDNKFITIGSSTYEVADATPEMAGQLRQYLKSQIPKPLEMLNQMRQLPGWELLSQETRIAVEKEAAFSQLSGKENIADEVVTDLLFMPEHCANLAWIILRKKNNVTKDMLKSIITNDNAMSVCLELVEKAGLSQLGKKIGPQRG